MALADVHRLSTEQFLAIPGLPERVELIEGVIYDMSPEGIPHARPQSAILKALIRALPDHLVLAGGSVEVSDDFCPIPDVAVYRADVNVAYPSGADALLVVEVGVSTAGRDRLVKAPAYARGGVVELWLVAPEEATLTVCRRPSAAGYQDVQVSVWPAGLAGAVEAVSARLRGPESGAAGPSPQGV